MPARSAAANRAAAAAATSSARARLPVAGAQPGAPERLVGVDVPETGDDALVEQDGLERRPPAGELRSQPARREARAERLRARSSSRGTARARRPRARARCRSDGRRGTTSRVPSSSSSTARSCVAGSPVEAAGHPEVDESAEAALEPQQQVLPAPLDGDDAIALELLRDLEQVVGPREPRIEDLDARERAPVEPRRELRADRLDLRQLGIRQRRRAGCPECARRLVADLVRGEHRSRRLRRTPRRARGRPRAPGPPRRV